MSIVCLNVLKLGPKYDGDGLVRLGRSCIRFTCIVERYKMGSEGL